MKKIIKKINLSRFNLFLVVLLLGVVSFSFVKLVFASTPDATKQNPGQAWNEIGNGSFQITGPTGGPTVPKTFIFPDVDNTYVITAPTPVGTTGQVLTSTGALGQQSWATPTFGNVNGTGTTNFITKWSDAIGTLGNSLIFDNGTNVGIGTTAPATSFQVGQSGTNKNSRFWGNIDVNGGGSLTFGSGDSSIGYPSGYNLAFNTYNGSLTEKMRITSVGNVGIGTTNPTMSLDVKGSGAGHVIMGSWDSNGAYGVLSLNGLNNTGSNFYSAAGGPLYINRPAGQGLYFRENNADQMTILNGGNVGIGTITPKGNLDISSGNAGALPALVIGADVNAITRTNATRKFGVIAIPHYTTVEEPVALFAFDSDVSANNLRIGSGTGVNNVPTEISFYTGLTNTTLGGTKKMVINSLGNVGIGTTSPTGLLDIEGADPVLYVNSTSGSMGRIDFQNSGTSKVFTGVVTSANWGGLPTGTAINDGFTRFDGGAYTFAAAATRHVLTLLSSGNVGIGVAAPTASLHLEAGTIAANTAPLKFTSGPLLTTAEAGAVEYNGTHFWGTVGTTRFQLDQQSSVPGAGLALSTGTAWGTSIANVAAGQPLLSGTTTPAYAGYTFAGTAAQTYTFPTATSTLLAHNVGISGGTILLGGTVAGDGITLKPNSADQNNGSIYLPGGMASTSTTTGALRVVGGVGIQGALNVGSTITGAGALALGTNTITSGLINGQNISVAANFTGTVAAAGTVTGTRFISNIVTGTAPFTVTSTTVNTNFNADQLDGFQATAFPLLAGLAGGQVLNGGTVTGDNLTLKPNSADQNNGSVILPGGMASTSTTTGALRVTGGIGSQGQIWAAGFNGPGTGLTGTAAGLTVGTASNIAGGTAGSINIQTGVGATGFLADVATGQPLMSAGVGIAPAYAGYTFSGTAAAAYTFPGATATLLANNVGISGGSTLVGGTASGENLTLKSNSLDQNSGSVILPGGLASTTTTTGALRVTGGVGIQGALNVGTGIFVRHATDPYLSLVQGTNLAYLENYGGQLHLQAQALPIYFETDSSYTVPKMMISTAGYVGIGTTSPAYELDVLGTSSSGVSIVSQFIGGTGTSAGGFKIGAYDATAGAFWSGAVTPTTQNYALLARNTNTYLNAPNGDIYFLTANTGIPMIIKNSGNIGIGTINPTESGSTYKTEIYGATPQLGLSGSVNGVGQLVGIEFNQQTTSVGAARPGGAIKSVASGTYVGGSSGTYNSDLAIYTGAGGSNVERIRILTGGNVGIGTTNPGATLEVNGQVKITGGSPAAGEVLTSDAVGLATWVLPIAGVTGTGTQNYITKWNNAGGTTIGNSLVFDNGTGVGIGTTIPHGTLEVSNGTNAELVLNRQGQWATVPAGIKISTNSAVTDYWTFGMRANVTNNMYLNYNASNFMTVLTNGYVGIGTTAPATLLDVKGASPIIQVQDNAAGYAITRYRAGGSGVGDAYFGVDAGVVGLITGGGGIPYAAVISRQGAYPIQLATNNLPRMTISSAGLVGIRLTNPTAPLEINDSTWSTASVRPTVLKLGSYTDAGNEGPFIDFTSRWIGLYPDWVVGRIGGVYDGAIGNGGALTFYTNYGVGAASATVKEQMRINPLGNVGIGTSLPDVLGLAAGHTSLTLAGATGDFYANFELQGHRGVGGNQVGTISFFQDTTRTALISVNNGVSALDESSMTFFTKKTGVAMGERMRIDKDGNVGIGTVSPVAALDVERTNATPILKLYSNRTSDSAVMENRILFGGSTNSAWSTPNGAGIDFHVNYPTDGPASNAQLRFWAYPLTTGASPAMTINGGNVGIGTTKPAYKLDVVGSLNATSYYLNGVAMTGSQWTTNGTSVYYNTGNVGVGTSTPAFPLEVAKAAPNGTQMALAYNATEKTGLMGWVSGSFYIQTGSKYDVTNGWVSTNGTTVGNQGYSFFGQDGAVIFGAVSTGLTGTTISAWRASTFSLSAAGNLAITGTVTAPTFAGNVQLPASGTVGMNGGTSFGLGVYSGNRNSAVFDTIEAGGTDTLELNYYTGGDVWVGQAAAKAIHASNFIGAGTGLTGNATNLSIGGNALTATTATNALALGGSAASTFITQSNAIFATTIQRTTPAFGYFNGAGIEDGTTTGIIYSVNNTTNPALTTTNLGSGGTGLIGIGFGSVGNGSTTGVVNSANFYPSPSPTIPTGWGMYVASGYGAKIFLDATDGNIYNSGGKLNGQTITSAANFTGSMAIAGNTTIEGNLTALGQYGVPRIYADTLSSKLAGDALELQYQVAGDVVVSGTDSNLQVQGTGTSAFAGAVNIAGNTIIGGAGSGRINLYASYSGSPTNPGIEVINYAGVTTFSHNSNGGATNIAGTLGVTGNVILSETLYTKAPPFSALITGANTGSIDFGGNYLPLNTTGFQTWLHGYNGTTSNGYQQHLSLGLYRGSNTWTDGGFFVGLGGSDSYPTDYYKMGYGGNLTYTPASGGVITFLTSVNGVPYTGATANVNLGAFTLTNGGFTTVNSNNVKAVIAKSLTNSATAPTTVIGSNYLQLGAQEYGLNSYRLIEFGYNTSLTGNSPAYLGYQETELGNFTKGALVFGTRNTSVTADLASERMRITSAGLVGIGTTAPGGPLEVAGRIRATSLNLDQGTFANLTNNSPTYGLGTSNITLPGSTDGATQVGGFQGLLFNTKIGLVMSMDVDGQVGIGTTNPYSGSRLQVVGGDSLFEKVGMGGSYSPAANSTLNVFTPSASGGGIRIDKLANYETAFLGDGGSATAHGVLQLYELGTLNTQIYAGGNTFFNAGNLTAGGVGIGTSAPLAKLNIEATAGAADLMFSDGYLGIGNYRTTLNTAFAAANPAGNYLKFDLSNGTTTGQVTTLWLKGDGTINVPGLGTGALYTNAGTLTNTNPSDIRLKNTIDPLNYGLSEILQLKPKTFYYNDDINHEHLQYGFVAQEVQNIMPNVVRPLSPGSDLLGLETNGIYVSAIKAIQELYIKFTTEVASISNQLVAIVNRINGHDIKIKELEKQNNDLKSLVCLDHPTATICKTSK